MSASPLRQRIIERIRQQGPISFADYMRMALYEPGYGYYVSGPARMGWEGDYYTSTDVANLFAHCMGRQLQRMWEELGRPDPFLVVEQGAGRKDLATGVRTWAGREAPDFNAALDYRAQDINSGQDALLTSEPSQQQDETSRDDLQPQQAIVTPALTVFLSNELVDALPVHVVHKEGDRLYEIYVDIQNDTLVEVAGDPSSPEVALYLDDYKIPWRGYEDGWRAEINLDALRWIERTARSLTGSNPRRKRHGFILAIDYGDSARKLYTRERHYGTLTCYYQHQLTDRPLARPGEQDITAHVNFTALITEARKHGLRLQTLTTQRAWLSDMGIYEELERVRQREFTIVDHARGSDQGQAALLQWYNLRQRASLLTNPAGMGNFKVLILKR